MMTKLAFDGEGWGGCRGSVWIREMKGERLHITEIRYGAVVEADLEDGSLRSGELNGLLARGVCRVMKDRKKQLDTAA